MFTSKNLQKLLGEALKVNRIEQPLAQTLLTTEPAVLQNTLRGLGWPPQEQATLLKILRDNPLIAPLLEGNTPPPSPVKAPAPIAQQTTPFQDGLRNRHRCPRSETVSPTSVSVQ